MMSILWYIFGGVLALGVVWALGYLAKVIAKYESLLERVSQEQQDPDEDWHLTAEQDTLFRPYVGDDVQGFHKGQLDPGSHSDADLWSQVVDTFAGETMEVLEKKYPMPPRPTDLGDHGAVSRWYEDSDRIKVQIDDEFARIMAEKYPPRTHLQ